MGKIECVGKIEDRELSYCYTRILYRVIGSLMIIILYLRLNPIGVSTSILRLSYDIG